MRIIDEIKETIIKSDNEGTMAPYWLIIDPELIEWEISGDAIHQIASAITGPFFSRADAEGYLKACHYRFSEKAGVYCHSGHASRKYVSLYKHFREATP